MSLIKKIAAVSASVICAVSLQNYTVINTYFCEETTTYTVTFLDFDGDLIQTIEVEEGGSVDYSSIDTSSLNSHIDDYTQRRFYAWNITPEVITENTEIHALYQEAKLSIDSEPIRKEYYAKNGNISLDGLDVIITMTTQTNEIVDGEYVLNTEVINITHACTTQPSNLSEAFSEQNTAFVSVYPPSGNTDQIRPLVNYEISYLADFGDTNSDEIVDPVDATNALIHYSYESMNITGNLTEEQVNLADIDRNGKVDVVDATKMLQYYSIKSLDNTMDWEKFIFSAE